MNCSEIRTNISGYIDQALSADSAVKVRRHLDECEPCAAESAATEQVRRLMREHARVAPPRDLLDQIRVRVSIAAQPQVSLWDRMFVHLQNFLEPVAFPATAGVLATVLIFCGFVNCFSSHLQLDNDVQLSLQTPPKVRVMPPIVVTGEDGLVVLAEVDQQGRVTDFRVLNSPRNPEQLSELRRMLMFTQFDPATRFGVPTSARTVINVRRISIKG